MAGPTIVQSAVTQGTGTPTTATFAGAQTAGNMNLVLVGSRDFSTTPTTPTDSKGNVYTLITNTPGANGACVFAYACASIAAAGAGANTVSVSWTGGVPSSPEVYVLEIAPGAGGTALSIDAGTKGNRFSFNTTANAPFTVGPVTTGSANELMIGWCVGGNAVASVGVGWTLDTHSVTANGSAVEFQTSGGTGSSITASFSYAAGVSTNAAALVFGIQQTSTALLNFASWTQDPPARPNPRTKPLAGQQGEEIVKAFVPVVLPEFAPGWTQDAPARPNPRTPPILWHEEQEAIPALPYLVQTAVAEAAGLSVTFGSTVAVGDLIVVIAANQGGGTAIVGPPTDNSGVNQYMVATGASCAGGTTSMATYYAVNKAAGAWKITFPGGTPANPAIYAFEVHGVSAFDNGAGATATSVGPASTGAWAVGHVGEFVLSATINSQAAAGAGPGYKLIEITPTFADCLQYTVVGLGSQTTTAILDGSSQEWGIVAAGFFQAPPALLDFGNWVQDAPSRPNPRTRPIPLPEIAYTGDSIGWAPTRFVAWAESSIPSKIASRPATQQGEEVLRSAGAMALAGFQEWAPSSQPRHPARSPAPESVQSLDAAVVPFVAAPIGRWADDIWRGFQALRLAREEPWQLGPTNPPPAPGPYAEWAGNALVGPRGRCWVAEEWWLLPFSSTPPTPRVLVTLVQGSGAPQSTQVSSQPGAGSTINSAATPSSQSSFTSGGGGSTSVTRR